MSDWSSDVCSSVLRGGRVRCCGSTCRVLGVWGRGPAGRFRADCRYTPDGGGAPPCKDAIVPPRGRYAVRLSSRRLPMPPDFPPRTSLPPLPLLLFVCWVISSAGVLPSLATHN